MLFEFMPWQLDVDIESTKLFYYSNDYSKDKALNQDFIDSLTKEQKYFFADKNQNLEMWNDICLGEFEVINVPGNHVTCIHSEENATLLAQIIIERNIRG